MITLAQAKSLRPGTTLYAIGKYNADGTAMRVKVNGRVKTWKTRPSQVQIPYKRGLYEYGYLDEGDLGWLSLTEPKPVRPKGKFSRR